MKVVIATPLYPPEIGGPATYAKALETELPKKGIETEVVKFATVRSLPKIVRHIVYFSRIFCALSEADVVLAFDTWSTGVPALLATRLRGKKMVVRIGGDFLWEAYLERTHELVKLSEFYEKRRRFTLKEKLFFYAGERIIRFADVILFNTAWQRDIWQKPYGLDSRKVRILENIYPTEREVAPYKRRTFVLTARKIALKNTEMVERVFADLKQKYPDIELDTRILPCAEHLARIRDAYAVIIPSVSEVYSNTAIDAIRYGKPFILPVDTGARARLRDVGTFVDTCERDALRRAIENMLDPEEYARACARVQAFHFSHSPEEMAEEFRSTLLTLCVH